MTWKNHIDYLCKKIAKSTGILYRSRNLLNQSILKNLYYSLIYSYISYAIIAWGNNYKTRLMPLFRLQKCALRTITFSASRPLFQKLELLNLFEIVKLHQVELVYDASQNQLPGIFLDSFQFINHCYSTRSKAKKNLFLPRVNLNYGKFGYMFSAVKVWNDLPVSIKNSKSKTILKKDLKKLFLSSDQCVPTIS